MTMEAVSFDLGASASVRLQLVSSDGLAPLPMPFNGKDDKFSQMFDVGVGGRSPDVSRGLAALSWTIENLRREPADATQVSRLTHESPVPVVVDSSATPVLNSVATPAVDSAGTPMETRRPAASETVVTLHVDEAAGRRFPQSAVAPAMDTPAVVAPAIDTSVKVATVVEAPAAVAPRVDSPVVGKPVVETVVVERRESADASQVSRLASESPVLSAVDSAATPKETRRPAASEAVVTPQVDEAAGRRFPQSVVAPAMDTPAVVAPAIDTSVKVATAVEAPAAVAPRVDLPVADKAVVETVVVERREPADAPQVSRPTLEAPVPFVAETVVPSKETPVPVVAEKVVPSKETPLPVAAESRIASPVVDRQVVETVVAERREPADAPQVPRPTPESPVPVVVETVVPAKETPVPVVAEIVVPSKETPLPVAAEPRIATPIVDRQIVETVVVERREPVDAPQVSRPTPEAPVSVVAEKVVPSMETPLPAAAEPIIATPVVDRQVVETVVVERREPVDASQFLRPAPESPVLSAVDSAATPMETRLPAASETGVPLQVNEAAGLRFPQSEVAPAIDTSVKVAPTMDTPAVGAPAIDTSVKVATVVEAPSAVAPRVDSPVVGKPVVETVVVERREPVDASQFLRPAPESPVLSAVDSAATPMETRLPAASETGVPLQVNEAAGLRFPQSVVAPAIDTPVAAAPVVEKPSAPVVEKPSAPVVEKPTAPIVEKPAAPVVEKPTAPVVEKPAVKANEKADNIPSVIEAPAVAAPVAAVPVDAAPQVAAAQSARTEAVAEAVGKVVEIVNEVVEAIVDKIAVTPALAQGEGEIRITLKPTVLDGSEIMLSAKSGELTVHIAPATAEAAQVVQQNLPRLEVALAGHASSFHHVAVVMASAKKGKTYETA